DSCGHSRRRVSRTMQTSGGTSASMCPIRSASTCRFADFSRARHRVRVTATAAMRHHSREAYMRLPRVLIQVVIVTLFVPLAACASSSGEQAGDTAGTGTGRDAASASAQSSANPAPSDSLPPDAEGAAARLESSPRHAEWAMVPTGGDSIRAWVVYPEREQNAPVVLVVHEIFGLTPWIRAVADQLAAEGFIAVAPDLLTGMDIPGAPENPDADAARAAIRNLEADDVQQKLIAIGRWGMALPAASDNY